MAPSAYTESELGALVAFLRNMSSVSLSAVKLGDPTRGRALFVGKGNCDSCHRVGADGPRAAPDLTSIGATRTAATLERSLLDPNVALLPTNRPVRAVLRDGTVVLGQAPQRGHVHGAARRLERTARLARSRGDSRVHGRHRARRCRRIAELSADERADLVAYLLSLKGQN